MELKQYDKYIIAFSGGKDSIACFLHLLDSGVSKDRIELWHHLIDGKEETFMDWEVTEDYCRKFAEAFGVKIYFSWKEGGFKREMLRDNQLTAATSFETPEGIKTTGGILGKKSTRLKFPQVSPNLQVRWCSAYLKIDVCATAIRNQERFKGLKTVVISGERGEESKARAGYSQLEPDRSDLRSGIVARYVDRMRPIRDWTEQQVWGIIEKYGVIVHPCYYLGWSRCSCKFCIFGNKNQFASAHYISPIQAEDLMSYETIFGITLKRNSDLRTLIASGEPYKDITKELALMATSKIYTGNITTNKWFLPAGAYGESCGPS